jgi:hypothetical protein
MTTTNRLLNLVLRGNSRQFNNILQEELKERASILMEKLYKIEAKNSLLIGLKDQQTLKNINNNKG